MIGTTTKARRAFTLVELLVVISIIALLVSILLPSLSRARMHAKRVASASNMRQIGIAMEMYAEDNRGYFPETSHGLTGIGLQRSWIYTLRPYLADVDEVRICPADPKREERLKKQVSSYILNEYIAVDYIDPFGQRIGRSYRNLHKLRRAAETITTFVVADYLSASVTSDHTHSRLWFLPPPNVPWDTLRKDIQVDRYGDSTLFLYADTRVETIQAQAIQEMAENNYNFAKPH